MPSIPFDNDPFSRTALRGLLLLQPAALVIVLGLSLLDLFFLALVVSFLTLFILFAVILWLYLHYRKLPIVREKRRLEHLLDKFQRNIQTDGHRIQAAIQERNRLFQSEKDEVNAALRALQKNYIDTGLEYTKPLSLPDEQLEALNHKYQTLQDQNNAAERNAIASKQILEHEIASLKPRLRQLASFTFIRYLSKSLASRGMVAALVAFLLISTQVLSSVSATGSAILALIPMATPTASVTRMPTASPSATQTAAPTASQTSTATITNTPTISPTPAITFTTQPTLPPGITSCIPQEAARESALVVGIVDGDTIDVRIDDQVFRVRYIGIDTPERDQSFYNQAAAYNQALVYNKTVTLIKDQSETDRFDRLLRYVIAGDTFVNYELADQGLALASAYPPDTACAGMLETAQRQAATAKLGVWVSTPEPVIVPQTGGGGNTGNCHPAYPGVCIPPPPPDLDCPQISYTDFTVLPPDPHRFDREGDGIGCES